jgi:hypothetical protein
MVYITRGYSTAVYCSTDEYMESVDSQGEGVSVTGIESLVSKVTGWGTVLTIRYNNHDQAITNYVEAREQ